MRLIIIRHGDPDYERDSLTEKGWREAELLAERIAKLNVKEFYVSPLGRAKDTASLTLAKMNRTATECEWLREFGSRIWRPDNSEREMIAWDWLPEDWAKEEEFFRRDLWHTQEIMKNGTSPATGKRGVGAEYDWVIQNFDALLAGHGYRREGEIYRVEKANRDTLVFFCHFGLECVLLSHLMHVSPMILWHQMCAAPTSVTTIYTEERREGIANFRISSFGDVSHLYVAGEEPAFSARFCETYDCMEERHD
ncbi:MAG: histidine phosphatase family protein [Roseburia sp.]|nr:histidine phosphatase family protein [Roseburia sp.]